MARFENINAALTASAAREVGAGASFLEATYYLDGQEPKPVNQGLRQVRDDATGEEMLVRTRLGSLLDHEDIADAVRSHEKAGLLIKKTGDAITGSPKDNVNRDLLAREQKNLERAGQGLPPIDPEGGQPYEWDHWNFSLSPTETAWLKANPDREAEVYKIVQEGMRAHPLVGGTRQALITPIHKDTGDWHIQGLVSRFAIDYSLKPPAVSPAAEVGTQSHMSKLIARMQKRFTDANIPIVITKGPEIVKNRTLFEGRTSTDADKEAYSGAVQDAGGVPHARTTVGPIPASPATARAIADIEPEVSQLERGKALAVDEGLKLTQRLRQLEAEQEATRTAMLAVASREATFDQAIAAIGQKAIAEAQAAEAAHARELAEQEAARAKEAAIAAQKTAEETQEYANNLAAKLRETEAQAEAANKLAAERFVIIEGEPDRIELAKEAAVEPVQATLDATRTEMAELRLKMESEQQARKSAEDALAEEQRTFVDRARAWATENVASPLIARAEAAEALLRAAQETIASFPARMEAEIDRRMAAMESRMQGTFDRMMTAAEARFDAAMALKDQAIDTLRAAAAAPVAAVAAAAGRAAGAIEGTQRTRQPRPGADFNTVAAVANWTPEQRRFAEQARENLIGRGRLDSSVTIEDFAAEAHRQWLAKNPASSPETDQGSARPAPTRKR